jgi:2-oxoglutarate ferredoxin oxidoreductase subunit beta
MKTSPFDNPKENTWCPGCGNFSILNSMKTVFEDMDLAPEDLLIVSGIGQAAKLPHFINANGFNGLHGRALPVAFGAHVANSKLKIVVNTGDGDALAEGGNHFIHAIRKNLDITHLIHDNQVYGLTKGQASPTTPIGQKTSLQIEGVRVDPMNPVTLAISLGCSFVARASAGDMVFLKQILRAAMDHKGYALIDILQPCITFNKVNTFQWFKDRAYPVPENYDPYDKVAAFAESLKWGDDGIPIGILYREDKPSYYERLTHIKTDHLAAVERKPTDIQPLLNQIRL